jgi:preprotein translocase subunit YajC
MDIIAALVELIPTLGFPIVLVIAMGWFIYKIYKQSVERENALMAELQTNREVNAQAISTIALYAERLTNIEGNIVDIKTDLNIIKEKV